MNIGEPKKEVTWIEEPDKTPMVEPLPDIGEPTEVPQEVPQEVPLREPVPIGVPLGPEPMQPGVRRIGFGPEGPDISNSIMSVPLGLNWKKLNDLGYLHEDDQPQVRYLPNRRTEPEITRLD